MALSALVSNGEIQCDECDTVAVAIGHDGTDVHCRCARCFLASLERDHKNRPSLEEMVARVNASLA